MKRLTPGTLASIVLAVGVLAGFVIRYPMLFYMGVFDMDAYYDWGKDALEIGLPRSYHGIYFPFQYQLFEFCTWIVSRSGVEFFTVFKVSNLIFDLGSFVLLVLLLKRQRSNPAFALLYWLHPWFLSVFALGYCDFQFTFFVLLCTWFLRRDTARDYVFAGIPLGVAFLMKPQAQILMVVTFLYALFCFIRRRDARAFGMMAGPIFLFLGYEAYFVHSLPHFRHWAALVLPLSYLNITNIMPALTAQMTNIWSPIAYLIKRPDEPILAISDQIQLLPYISAKYLAAGTVLTLVGIHVWRIEREVELSPSDKFATIFAFATMAVPFLMTSAHENHLFLGTVFLVLIGARSASLSLQLAVQILLLVQFLNIYSLYGAHPAGLAQFLKRTQSDGMAVVYSVISLVCFGLIAKRLWTRPTKVVSAPGSPGSACS
jgi:hypothetical protein